MKTNDFFITFIVSELYYIPIFEPVADEIKKHNLKALFLIRQEYNYRSINTHDLATDYLESKGFNYKTLEDDLSNISSKFAVFSANGFRSYDFDYTYTILMSHGIGTKGGYFNKEHTKFDIRFVEGTFREKRLKELFPLYENSTFQCWICQIRPSSKYELRRAQETDHSIWFRSSEKNFTLLANFLP